MSQRIFIHNNIPQEFKGDKALKLTVICGEGTGGTIAGCITNQKLGGTGGCICEDRGVLTEPNCNVDGKGDYCKSDGTTRSCINYVACKQNEKVTNENGCDCDSNSPPGKNDALGMMECAKDKYCDEVSNNVYECQDQTKI